MSRVIEINSITENNKFIATYDRAVIFFGSKRCNHCTDMVDFYNNLPMKYPSVGFAHVEVTKVDTKNINGVPAFVGYKNSEPIGVVLGSVPKGVLSMIETKLL